MLRLLLASAASLSAGSARAGRCDFLHEAYAKQIRRHIESGIPFELMSLITSGEQVLSRQEARIEYDLWTEVVEIKDLRGAAKVPLAGAEARLCESLLPDSPPAGRKAVQRILLNPLWEGRVERLRKRLNDLEHNATTDLLDIDWSRLTANMPKEDILVTRELTP